MAFPFLEGEQFNWGSRFGWSGIQRDYASEPNIPGELIIKDLLKIPVVSGLIMLLGFAVVIGPLNYLYLKKSDRLSMMLLTIPVLSILATGFIFAWDIFKHGLGNDVRGRGVIRIDQKENTAAYQTRYLLYMAIAPGRLTFPADSTVSFLPHNKDQNHDRGSKLKYTWDQKHQYIGGAAAKSRSPIFMDTRNVQPFRGRLVVERVSKKKLKVTNGLGFSVHHLVLSDKQGRLYVSENGRDRSVQRGEAVRFIRLGNGSDSISNKHARALEARATDSPYAVFRSIMEEKFGGSLFDGFSHVPQHVQQIPGGKNTNWFIGFSDHNTLTSFGVNSVTENESRYLIQGFHWATAGEEDGS